MALKWGIAAAGRISHDFVNAVSTLNKADHQVLAVAARDLSRAQEFADRFDIPKAYSSYLELANSDVEVVYIGTLHPQHLEVGLLMLEHGKHVLCEKKLCMNEKQVRKLVACAKQKNLFLMEAIWSRLFLSYQYVRQQINSGKLGDILSVDAEFGFSRLADVDRITTKEMGGGTILDLGIYNIQVCQWVFQKEPISIKATGKLNEDGVDLEMSAELSYGPNKTARIKTNALKTECNTARIVGSKGQITIPSFWAPTMIIDVDGKEKSWPLPEAKLEFNHFNSAGLRYEADEARKCIRAGKMESENVSHNESIIIARIEDEIRKQIGVKYAENN